VSFVCHSATSGLAGRYRLHDGLDIHGRLPRLAELLVRHQAFLLVEDRDEPEVGLRDQGARRRAPREPVVLVQREVVGEVELTRLHLCRARRYLGHRDPAHLVDMRHLGAAVAVGLLRPRPVVVEADHPEVLIGLPFRDAERAGAHELGDLLLWRELLGDLLRIDRGEVVGDREGEHGDGRALREPQLDGMAVDGFHVGDLLEEHLAGVRLLPPALQGGDHILGAQLLPVVELYALTELERVDEPVP
jgi:hypothetical protein